MPGKPYMKKDKGAYEMNHPNMMKPYQMGHSPKEMKHSPMPMKGPYNMRPALLKRCGSKRK